MPGRGMIGIFNRSHYEDVLVVRVENIVPEDVWRPRYEVINNFEKHLVTTGTTVLKLFLHISKKEQKERFQARLDEPDKHWKFDQDDLNKRRHWDEYQLAFQDMVSRSTVFITGHIESTNDIISKRCQHFSQIGLWARGQRHINKTFPLLTM